MGEKEIKGYFAKFSNNIKQFRFLLDEINKGLDKNVDHITSTKGQDSLEKHFIKHPEDTITQKRINFLITHSCLIVDTIEQYAYDFRSAWKIEENKKWKVWVAALIRWLLGAVAVVLLYSCLVWIADNCGFIKIPIKDWFITSVK